MSGESPRSHEVFISHSSKDKAWADAACAVLERHRIRCWIAPRDIVHGADWTASIMDGIERCRVMVLIFSGHANASPQVLREVECAVDRGMSVVPCRVEDVPPQEAMEFLLSTTHWLDAFTEPVEQQMENLAESVKQLLETPQTTDAAPPQPPPPRDRPRWVVPASVAAALAIVATGAMLLNRERPAGGGPGPVAPAAGVADDLPAPLDTPEPPRDRSLVPPKGAEERPPARPAVKVLVSQFSDGTTQGWTTRNRNGTTDATAWIKVQGNGSNRWLAAKDLRSGPAWGWCAPAPFLGDQSDKFGRYLHFSLMTSEIGNVPGGDTCVRITGAGSKIFVDMETMGMLSAKRWKKYRVALDSSGGWKLFINKSESQVATDTLIREVLGDVTEIWIKGEFAGEAVGYLDDVSFGTDR